MREITLREYETSGPVPLSVPQRDALAELIPSLLIEPCAGTNYHYRLTPGNVIGAVTWEDLAIIVRPKIPIDRVMFLISYVLRLPTWGTPEFSFAEADSLVEAVVLSFTAHLQRALRRGLIQNYRETEDSLTTIRGRIRFAEQLKKSYGRAPPVEVAYDEFTEDITENRLLKAALERLRSFRIRSPEARRKLRHFEQILASVSLVRFEPSNLPTVRYSRLNEHYRPAVELAKLILGSRSLELRHGRQAGSAFLVDMNQVFEEFVYLALRDALGLTPHRFRRHGQDCDIHLDVASRVVLKPDLSWWEEGECVFVGDVKYKRISVQGIKHPDLYQLLAYTIAADLPAGLLVYAAGELESANHEIVFVDKRLEVVSIDLRGTPDEILEKIRALAVRVRAQRTSRSGELFRDRR
jgi:5-methylcytosine-specific restriction enzyme subunit McrC